jgi:hypothetical protein
MMDKFWKSIQIYLCMQNFGIILFALQNIVAILYNAKLKESKNVGESLFQKY